MYNKFREKMKEILLEGKEPADRDLLSFTEYLTDEYQRPDFNFKLYRYMPANYDSIRNLEKEVIFLSSNGVMNDIYEGLPQFTPKEITYDKLKILEDIIYMKSFSETHDEPLMWGHYANGASGFCVEYDLSLIDIENEMLTHIFPVIYSKKRPNISCLGDMIKDMKWLNEDILADAEPGQYLSLKDMYYLFLSKGEEWKYEREWRMLYTKCELYDKSSDLKGERTIPFPYVSAIYFGAKLEEKYKEHIKEIVNRLDNEEWNNLSGGPRGRIKLWDMKFDSEKYAFDFEEIKE